MEFEVGQIVGNKSKTMDKFDPNTTMGFVYYNTCPVPLSWLHYEVVEYKVVKRSVV